MKKSIYSIIILLLCLAGEDAYAQRIVSDRYTYRYVMSETESFQQAKVNAVRQAQLGMIADHFGTLVSSTTAMTISETVSSVTYGDVEVKGEWLEDTAPPVILKSVVNDHFVLDVTVSGRIREIVSAPIDIKCHVLKNGTDVRYSSLDFTHGDRLYLSFKSPVDGYVAVYLGDRQTINCLFPYNGLSADIMKVDAGDEYVFFSKSKSGKIDPFAVREYPLGCSPGVDMEMVRLYVVFSPNKFTKANDSADGKLRTLAFNDFHAWLSRVRRTDPEMNLIPFDIIIRRN